MEANALAHAYDVLLGPRDPMAQQPTRITVPMKPHQRAALHKAIVMEQQGRACYQLQNPSEHISDPAARRRTMFRGRLEIESNIGILGDMVGYGKTLTALSIIASVPVERIHRKARDIYSFHARNYCHFTAICDRNEEAQADAFIGTTLVVTPRGPVFVQWQKALRDQTDLRALVIDGLHTIRKYLPPSGADARMVRAFFEQYDVVLVKSTTLKTLMDYYDNPYRPHPIQAWDRVMIDEAHDIVARMPIFSFRFLWLISATYKSLLLRNFSGRTVMAYAIRDILDEERMNLLLLKGATQFVMDSFTVPPMAEHYYLCALPSNLAAVHGFLSPSVQDRVNAGDIQGAIRELGGHQETESDILGLVTREIQRDIRNKEQELVFVAHLDLSEEARASRVASIQAELGRLRDRYQSLMDRVTELSDKQCSVCYDNYTNPIMLPCTHIFCGACLMNWMRNGHVCPECRQPIQCRGLVAIVKDPAEVAAAAASSPIEPPILSKEDTLLRIIREKPDGKFLVFSRCDYTFFRLIHRLEQERVTHAEMKGSTATMVKVLERFRNGELQVIMLNTYHAGSGIDISCATDVIMFHLMGDDGIQAIGRAQRVGRTTPLHVHHLCFSHELAE
jgi:SNF2 family DNA or RNA helicase